MLMATCFDSNESSSGHQNELIQDISYIRVHFGIPNELIKDISYIRVHFGIPNALAFGIPKCTLIYILD